MSAASFVNIISSLGFGNWNPSGCPDFLFDLSFAPPPRPASHLKILYCSRWKSSACRRVRSFTRHHYFHSPHSNPLRRSQCLPNQLPTNNGWEVGCKRALLPCPVVLNVVPGLSPRLLLSWMVTSCPTQTPCTRPCPLSHSSILIVLLSCNPANEECSRHRAVTCKYCSWGSPFQLVWISHERRSSGMSRRSLN